ncbi:MAG: hypothetical protein RIE56_08495 [Amphiplicatus sp.]
MRRILGAIFRANPAFLAALAVAPLASAQPAAGAELLLDPSFSASTFPDASAAWTIVDPAFATLSGAPGCAPFRSLQIQNSSFANNPGGDAGTNAGVWFKSYFTPEAGCPDPEITGSVEQTVAAVEGATYDLSAVFKLEPNFTAGGLSLELLFLDAGMTPISASAFDVLSAHPKDSSWIEYALSAVAPTGTAFATVSAIMTAGQLSATNPQGAMVDDFSLTMTPVPVPAALGLFGLGVAGLGLMRRARSARNGTSGASAS